MKFSRYINNLCVKLGEVFRSDSDILKVKYVLISIHLSWQSSGLSRGGDQNGTNLVKIRWMEDEISPKNVLVTFAVKVQSN